MTDRPWAASDETGEGVGVVRLFDANDNLVAELTPDRARELSVELADVASYASQHTEETP